MVGKMIDDWEGRMGRRRRDRRIGMWEEEGNIEGKIGKGREDRLGRTEEKRRGV